MADDYTQLPLSYKLRKALRYFELYGLSRTLIKIRSQYHMRSVDGPLAQTWINPGAPSEPRGDIGIIGCGNFAYSTIAYYCNRRHAGNIRAVYDPVGARAVSLCRQYKAMYAAASPDEVLQDSRIRLVFIASNHASHAEHAIRALEAGKAVHIEKPHVVSQSQLERLLQTVRTTNNHKIFLGFNRPRSPHFKKIREIMQKQPGPAMINWFIAGHAINDSHWYFSEQEGGRILGNLCHWTDLSLRMVGLENALPVTVVSGTAVSSKSDFALTFTFGDGSVASITFSAKGHTFDGVREYLNVHKGDALITMRDFHETSIDIDSSRRRFKTLLRDHGHKANIYNSIDSDDYESMEITILSARLFLAAKQAVDDKAAITVA